MQNLYGSHYVAWGSLVASCRHLAQQSARWQYGRRSWAACIGGVQHGLMVLLIGDVWTVAIGKLYVIICDEPTWS